MTDKRKGTKAAADLDLVRQQRPLVHNITNHVVMNVTANALLAAGAMPVMAHAKEEAAEMAAMAGALVLNIGTLSPFWVDAMLLAGRRANELGVPVILDPVGSGATTYRTETAKRILRETRVAVLRGNASEIISLMSSDAATKGVESVHGVDEATGTAVRLAKDLKNTVVITGEIDLVTDGDRVCRVENGHQLMSRITGAGCTATALIGAFHAVDRDPVEASASALAFFGLAGESAAQDSRGPGSFQAALLDSLYCLTSSELESGAKISVSRAN